jgi:hypothetical protein
LATAVVAVLPVAIVWGLWIAGIVTSVWVAAPLAIALSLLASTAASAYWKRRPAAGDLLFSDLLLWGWARRVLAERRAGDAVERLSRAGTRDDTDTVRLLERLARALDAKDPYLDGHSQRVARYSALMARRLGVPEEEAERIRTAAAVHDVGKLRVPADILAKPGGLTPEEAEAVQRHADEGAAMVACLGDPALSEVVRHHHERFDGGGYPAGLSREDIPLGARIIAVADTFDAVTSARPYRPAGTHKHALDELAAVAGTQLDPVVVRAFTTDYAHRRGLALWALLTLPVATAKRHPLPVGAVLGTAVVVGVVAMTRFAGDIENPARGAAAQAAGPAVVVPAATAAPAPAAAARGEKRPRRAHRRARHAATTAARPAATTGTASGTPATRLAAAAPRSTAKPSPLRLPQHGAPSPAPRVTPPKPSPPRTTSGPAPAPPSATPPAPAAATTPPPAATPTAPPPPAPAVSPPAATFTPEQCKNGGWVALGFRNQGQCVSAAHGH